MEPQTDEAAEPQRVLISSARKPVTYLGMCKRALQESGEVHLSALGVAISSLVTVSELLKARGYAVERALATSLETREGQEGERARRKPKMEVVLAKAPGFDALLAEEAAHEAAGKAAAAAAAPPAAAKAEAAPEAPA